MHNEDSVITRGSAGVRKVGGLLMGVVIVLLLIGCYIGYQRLLRHGMRERTVVTTLTPDVIREIFQKRVATLGWKYHEQADTLVARQGLGGGVIRQEISCHVQRTDSGATMHVRASKVTRTLWGYNQSHTVRMRLNAFVRDVRSRDPQAVVADA